MRAAPPVDVGLASGRREQAAVAALWGIAGAVSAAWLAALVAAPAWVSAIGAVLFGICGWRVATPMRGRLRWDGSSWQWQRPGGVAALDLSGWRAVLDLGGWLLLRDDAGHWCGLSAGDAPAQWHGLRVALHSTTGAEAPPRSW